MVNSIDHDVWIPLRKLNTINRNIRFMALCLEENSQVCGFISDDEEVIYMKFLLLICLSNNRLTLFDVLFKW